MLQPDDPWFLDEAVEEPDELLKALPELRQNLVSAPPEDELGLRSLLEQADTFTHPWWRDQASKSGRKGTPVPRPRAA